MNRKFTWELDIDLHDGIIADGEWSAVTGIDIYMPAPALRPSAPGFTDTDPSLYVRAMHTERGTVFTTHATLGEITVHAALAAA